MPGRLWFPGTLQNWVLKPCQRVLVLIVPSQCPHRCLRPGQASLSLEGEPHPSCWEGLTSISLAGLSINHTQGVPNPAPDWPSNQQSHLGVGPQRSKGPTCIIHFYFIGGFSKCTDTVEARIEYTLNLRC